MEQTEDQRDNLTRLLNLGRRRRARVDRRYTSVVRGLRLALPLLALAIVAVVAAWPKMDVAPVVHQKQDILPQAGGRNELVKPQFQSMTTDHKPYVITAQRAVQDQTNSSVIRLDQPVARITLKDDVILEAQADSGLYHQTERVLTLDGNVIVHHQDGYTLRTRRLNISIPDRVSWTDTFVSGDGPEGAIEARAMNANNETGVVIFTGPAKLTVTTGTGGKK